MPQVALLWPDTPAPEVPLVDPNTPFEAVTADALTCAAEMTLPLKLPEVSRLIMV